jgi:hypothetical protein
MKNGIIFCNADDPRTAYIGQEKEADTLVTYYGFDIDLVDKHHQKMFTVQYAVIYSITP